ncbi:MAG: AmmeMemoRadiSam system protein B [Gemmataceae bacterium]|nr:AmmeMemoRadiSam system protein B [Gemmataceae bacterium]
MDRPRLRLGLARDRDSQDSAFVVLWDQLKVSGEQRLTQSEFDCVKLFDGQRTLPEIQRTAARQHSGEPVSLEKLAALVRRLDEALLLDGPGFRERVSGRVREPSCIGCYPADPDKLRQLLRGLFAAGPGLPGIPRPDGSLRAALIPHIDYERGGVTFAWGFKEVFERTDASLFVIIGTSHCSYHRFTLTRKDFKTPLGIIPTDQDYIDRLVAYYGDGLFDDEVAHLPEHSIELEVVFLQYLYETRRPIRIVPLVVGSFHDCVQERATPTNKDDIGRMVDALRRVEAEMTEPICYIISGDLAHIGPKFGDFQPVDAPQLRRSRKQDEALVRHAEAADLANYYQVLVEEGDERRICGLPPTYTTLAALQPGRGKLLHYDQYVHPRGYESVSFASVAFYR